MPSVGYATLQIIPSVRGIGDELRRQLVGPAGDAGGQAGQAAGGSLRDKVKGGAVAAGAAAGALLVAGIVEAMEHANVKSTLQAQLGTTDSVAAAQGKIAGKLYGEGISGSFQEAADAVKAVVQSGLAPPGTTNAQLQAIATKASDVANVFGQDLGGVTNAVSQMMRTGLAKNSTEAFDLITAGFQSGADKGGDLLDTINEYGTQFRKAGLSGADAMGLLNQAIAGGARNSDVAADAIKEFAIRAVDGSKTTADGFMLLGLNADEMAAKFGKGGKTSKAALDLTLDRLRGIKDPVKQSQAAVALFGTQAEDLGQALFAMDPSKAAKGLGDFGGAASKAGETIRSGPSHEITVFTRALKQGFVDFVGGRVLPVIADMARWFNANLLPPLRQVASVLVASLGPALRGLLDAGMGVVNWLRDMGTWLIPLGVLVGGLTLMLSANALATAATTAAFSLYRGVILAWSAITRVAIGVQAAWNAVMALNPIGLVVIALIALGAAMVVAWKRSETFRTIVMGAWEGIKTGVMWVWNNALKPFFSWLGGIVMWVWNSIIKPYLGLVMLYFRTVGTVAMWLWHNAISPVINFIVAGFKLWWAGVQIYFNLVKAAFRAVGDAAMWLWNNAISPVIDFIVAGFKLWWAGVKLYFNLVKAGFRAVGAAAMWLWNNAIMPAFNGIKKAISLAWAGVKIVFGAVRAYIFGPLAAVFRWIRDSVVKPVWNDIKAAISFVWNRGIRPVFDAVKRAVGRVGDAFGRAKDAVKRAWDKLKGIAKAPISFIINTVYNRGIVGVWNKVAGAFGAPKLSKFKGFATGGVLPGYTPGRDVHLAALSGGEAVMRPEWTRAVGPGYVNTMNSAARAGGVAGVQKRLGIPGFADGGIFGWIKGAASKGWDLAKSGVSWLKDGIKASAMAGVNKIVRPLIERISGSASLYKDMVTGVPKKMISALFGFSGKADKKLSALGIGGKGTQAALKWARTQHGKRYQWGGNGNPSWDCSGFMSAIESVIRGQKPHRRWSTHAFKGGAPSGWVRGLKAPFMVGITHSGVGHTAGTLNKTKVESRGGDGVVVGKRARGHNNSLFSSWYGFRPLQKYDGGGWLQPGVTQAVNATGRPEAVLTGPQWRAVSEAAARGGSSLDGARLRLRVGEREFDAYVEELADGRVAAGNQRLLSTVRAGRKSGG